MSRSRKLYLNIISGKQDNNIKFSQLINFLLSIGFQLRINGSHHILFKDEITEIINLQPLSNGFAKLYQVKQVRNILVKYKLGENE